MTLYNLRSADGDWRITKFTNELDPEGSYLVSADACTCPAGVRPTCRHRQMLPKFLAAGAEDSGMFFHFETEQFLAPDLGESNSSSDFGEADDSSADSEVEFAENVSAELTSHGPTVTTADFDSANTGSTPVGTTTHPQGTIRRRL